jgi:hypothetical protein
MVERKESSGLTEFQGKVLSIVAEDGVEGNKQFHVEIEPIDVKVAGKTGKLHEWIPLSHSSSNDAVAKGSVMDLYLRQVEIVVPAAKKAQTVEAALKLMIGKKFQFSKMELGRAYQGNAARQYAVPIKSLD